jgi:type IV secretion system protein VirB10
VQYIERPAPAPLPQQPFQPARMQEPALVIDLTEAAAVSNGDAVHAQVMHHRSMTIPQGTIIPAVLETPINSSTPGLTRAIVSKDIRGFDGARVLIPKGSRLFGEYQSDVKAGQSRAVVNWTNLVRPDGVSIHLASPASDANGRTGIPGHVNNHILARLTSAVLQSSLEFGENYAYRSTSSGSVIVSAPIQTVASASTPLIPSAQAAPTITVQQGADIAVLVARDLDFTGTPFRQ